MSKVLAFGTILTCLGTRSKSKCLILNTHRAKIKPGRGQRKKEALLYTGLGLGDHRSQEGQRDRIQVVPLNTRLGEWLGRRGTGRERGVWKLCAVVLMMRCDGSLDHVAGNRAGKPGGRESQVHSQQDLVADHRVKADSGFLT